MPRIRKHSTAQAIAEIIPIRIKRQNINLRALPNLDPIKTTSKELSDTLFSRKPPARDLYRSRFGRALNLDIIESSLRAADWGGMQMLTDLSRETIDTDPHLASVLNKRFGSVSTLPFDIIPAAGIGISEDRATYYADVVRNQLLQLPDFGQRVNQLAWGFFDGRAALENEWVQTQTLPNLPVQVHPTFGPVTWQIKNLGWIHPRRLQFGPERELRVCDDASIGSFSQCGIALRDFPCKFVYWTPQLYGDYPEREGLARRAIYWSFFKRFAARERNILLELFGKPWRWLEVSEDSTADTDDLNEADEMLQNIGGNSSFRFPRGTEFKVEQPNSGAGQVHQTTIEESDKQISKLVLGQTGTTDQVPGGFNNSQPKVMQDEQFMLLVRDSEMISDVVETFLTDAIIKLNFGSDQLNHAPTFRLRPDVPLNRTDELIRLKAAIEAGLEIPLSEAYEVSGFRRPKQDEAIIKIETPPLHPLAVQPPPERPVIAYPESTKLPGRKMQPISPAGDGGLPSPSQRPPEQGGGGLLEPDLIEAPTLTIGETNLSKSLIDERFSDYPALIRAHPSDRIIAHNMIHSSSCPHCVQLQAEGEEVDEDIQPGQAPQPEEAVVGSIEVLIDKGTREGARATGRMGVSYADAVEGFDNAPDISVALQRAHMDMDIHELSRSIERRNIQGALAGVISSNYEVETDNILPVTEFEKIYGHKPLLLQDPTTDPKFVNRSLAEAIKWFTSKNIVSRIIFDQLSAASKRRAFTIAGVTNDQMLKTAQDELTKLIISGGQLRDFRKFVLERFKTAGFTPVNPSHVETIYRTNVLSAYNSGRHAHATQPSVLSGRPFWQIRTVNDGQPRQRKTHQRVHKYVLKASDSFWRKAYPPFGFNCRCRVVTMSQADVDSRSLRVRSGSDITGLPDRGFTSGVSTLL